MIFILKGSPMIGIYSIKNVKNNNCYFGSSKNIEKRWKTHLNKLKNNKHHNIHLQRAWNKYGENNFIFEIVEECDEKNLLQLEQKYIDFNPEYNIGMKSSGGDNITKNPNRDKIVKKITESVKKRFDEMTDDERKEKHSQPMEKNPNWKGGTTYVYCECGKRIGQGHTHCNKCRPRSNGNNPFFGKQHTDETKNKLSETKKGKYYGEQNIPIIIDGIEYRSAGEASKILNIPMVTIRWRVMSKNKKFDNYRYKD
jgi:group I intron endonuclease